jgi:hypothetical protein
MSSDATQSPSAADPRKIAVRIRKTTMALKVAPGRAFVAAKRVRTAKVTPHG